MITQHNRLICVFKEFFSVFWTNKIVGTVLHCSWNFCHFFCKCHYLTTINQHNRLICVFKEFFSVFWTDRGRRCTFYRFSVVLLVIRFCKSVTKGQCFQDKQKGQCHTVGLHLKGKQTSLTLGVLCLPQFTIQFIPNTKTEPLTDRRDTHVKHVTHVNKRTLVDEAL